MDASVGTVGDALDNALAESVIGLVKTELIRRQGPWRTVEHVEAATLGWVDWFNHHRLLEITGDIPPIELGQTYYRQATGLDEAGSQQTASPDTPGRFIQEGSTCQGRVYQQASKPVAARTMSSSQTPRRLLGRCCAPRVVARKKTWACCRSPWRTRGRHGDDTPCRADYEASGLPW